MEFVNGPDNVIWYVVVMRLHIKKNNKNEKLPKLVDMEFLWRRLEFQSLETEVECIRFFRLKFLKNIHIFVAQYCVIYTLLISLNCCPTDNQAVSPVKHHQNHRIFIYHQNGQIVEFPADRRVLDAQKTSVFHF